MSKIISIPKSIYTLHSFFKLKPTSFKSIKTKLAVVVLVVFYPLLIGCQNQTDTATKRTEIEINRTIDNAISEIGYNLRKVVNGKINEAFN